MKKNFMKITTITCLIVVALFVAVLPSAAKKPEPVPLVKNVILMIGDGMGMAYVDLTRLCKQVPELVMDTCDYSGLMTTNCLEGVTDSAAGGTALATGYKTDRGMISMLPDGTVLKTILERAEETGKATGLVSDVYLEDATPAAFATHVERRGMYEDIAVQLAYSGVEVLLGPGYMYFTPKGEPGGQRWDGRNLIQEMEGMGYLYVDTREELLEVDAPEGKLLGFFGEGEWNLAYTLDREEEEAEDREPTLPEMTKAAIEVLRQDSDGFFLMVEAGALDWMCTARDATAVIAETWELNQALQVVLDFAEEDGNTLVVVTADHECGGLQYSGDEKIDIINNIEASNEFMWGKIMHEEMTVKEALCEYANIDDLTKAELATIKAYGQMGIADVLSSRANVDWGWSGLDDGEHTLTPVPVFAFGPFAYHFEGNYDNTNVGGWLFAAVG